MFAQSSRRLESLYAAVFCLYVGLVAFVAWRHEPWFDEAQAWLMARDSGPAELLTDRLRYEGTPGLWHLVLLPPAKLGLPFRTVTIISAVIAAATVYLFLRHAPFPWYLKAAFPFGFFTLYQYAVVARNYTLMAFLLVCLAVVFRGRNRRPILFFVLLALLANVSVHGFLMAGLLTAYHLWHLWRKRGGLKRQVLRRHLIGAALLAALAVLIVLQLLPPEDLGFPAGAVRPEQAYLALDALTPVRLLSFIITAVLAVWFWRQGTFLLWAAPVLAVLWVFVFKWSSAWHEGVIYYYSVFCIWVTLDRTSPRSGPTPDGAAEQMPPAVKMAWAAVLGFHVYWGAVCSWHDVVYPYSAGPAACAYLLEHSIHERTIYAHGFSAVSVLPYFAENIFDNYNNKQNPSYFLWSTGNPLQKPRRTVCDAEPEFVLVSLKWKGDAGLECPRYELLRRFEARIFWKDAVLERASLYLYRLRSPELACNE